MCFQGHRVCAQKITQPKCHNDFVNQSNEFFVKPFKIRKQFKFCFAAAVMLDPQICDFVVLQKPIRATRGGPP